MRQHIKLQIKFHWVEMVAQLLLEETDHAQSLLVGTIAKHASQYLHNALSDEHVGSYWTDGCITANVILIPRIRPELCPTTLLFMHVRT